MRNITVFVLVMAMAMTMTMAVPAFAVGGQEQFSNIELARYDKHPYIPNDLMAYSVDGETAYNEEACLNELESFKNDDLELTSYTVLTPKATTSDEVLGTYSGSSKRVSDKDQSGIADLSVVYHPVDPAHFSPQEDTIFIKGKDNISVQSINYSNTNKILQIANSYYNRGEVCESYVSMNPYGYWE